MELWTGLILPIINLVFLLIFCPLVFWRWLSQEKRCNTLEKGFKSAEAEAKQSAEEMREMREQIRKMLIYLYGGLSHRFHTYTPEKIGIHDSRYMFQYLAQVRALWIIYTGADFFAPSQGDSRNLLLSWAQNLYDGLDGALFRNDLTTGHLATWRTEIAAAQIYLLQLDGRGRMGRNGGSRQFSDDEIRELAPLKGGMSWIIDRTKAGNCPFDFGRYIERDLEALIARIEALEPQPERVEPEPAEA